MSSLDYLDLCRLCLVKDRVSVPIFEGEGDVRQIFLKIAACLPVKVGREDKLPKKICDDCVYKVELFYQFWNTTANAEKQLLQWLGEVSMDDKQGYVTGAHDPSMMKPGQNTGENRLDGSSVMQQVNEHTNNMGMGMMDGMGIGMPMMIPNSGQQPQQQQMTSVPMDTGGNAVQNVQPVPGPSAQIGQQKINAPTNEDEDEDESEEEDNSDDECDGDDGLPVKEESEDEPNRTIEPTTFVNVSLACDEAGPSGLQQQKIGEMPEMVMPPTDGDPKSGYNPLDPLGASFLTVKLGDDYFRMPKSLSLFMKKQTPSNEENTAEEHFKMEVDDEPEKIEDIKIEIESPKKPQVISKSEKNSKSEKIVKISKKPCTRKSVKGKREKREKIETREMSDDANETNDYEEFDDLDEIPLDYRQKKAKFGKSKKLLTCEICYLIFDRKSKLTSHMYKHSNSRPHICTVCSKGFKTSAYLARHMEIHDDTMQEHACSLCDFKARTKPYLKIHHIRKHTDDYNFTCQECGKRFKVQSDYTTHMKDHDMESCVCDICGSSYTSKSSLYFHKHYKHKTKVKEFECQICKKRFKSQKNLNTHAELHKMKYVCEQCGMEFKSKYGLTKHLRTHSGEKSYLCAICGKTFGCLSSQKIHLLTHVGERPYVCDICGQSFTQRSPMMLHRRKHPGVNPPPPPIKITNLLHGVQDKIIINKNPRKDDPKDV
ncbi:zinc finger protein 570-like isoform X9 [Venturia canescens]|uniref:zinc finger protein 570-like isoform X9 n=1 Tax=Venturia canescens TaxID=32260 RepID=UPI001C9CBEEB|nr:zinc finger protein 570-like isoform X9 [Venturia canescens]